MLLEATQAANDYLSSPSPLANMVTAAGLSAWTIHKLKEWNKVPWINQNSDAINRAVSVAFALVTTLGLHIAFHDDATGQHHGGIVEIGLPSAREFMDAAWRTLGSYIMQQGAIRGFIKHEPGLKAADSVAGAIEENREEIADAVARRDDTVLKLGEPVPSRRMADDVPVEFPWTPTKDRS